VTKVFHRVVEPGGLRMKVLLTGPSGADAVECALRLARKATGRWNVVAFSGSYHGMTLGSAAVTSDLKLRAGYQMPFLGASFFPFPDGPADVGSLGCLEAMLDDPLSGLEPPAAVIVETIQADGGVFCASPLTLKRLRDLCTRHGSLLIVDDVQVGCGRTGSFFSTDAAGIVPDILVLSKSLSGVGLPLSPVLFREDLDVGYPGEFAGTFRGN